MNKEDLKRILERLKELKDSLDNSTFRGISLSNLPTWVWESLGESISDLEGYLDTMEKVEDNSVWFNLGGTKYRDIKTMFENGTEPKTDDELIDYLEYDISDDPNRIKMRDAYQYYKHLGSLLLNNMVNPHTHFLGEPFIEYSLRARRVIIKLRDELEEIQY